jgi:hypothetical protein
MSKSSDKPVLDKHAHQYPWLAKFGGKKDYGQQGDPTKFADVDEKLYQ